MIRCATMFAQTDKVCCHATCEGQQSTALGAGQNLHVRCLCY